MAEPEGATDWATWRGRSETAHDVVGATPLTALAATFDRAAPTVALPPLWHWLYFLPMAPMAEVGPDGHPKRGGFLPPIALPRRMWAGGRLTFHDAPRVGEAIARTSTILDVSEKTGMAGAMAFVTVRHEIATPRGPAITEEQDIVFLEMPKTFAPPPPTPLPDALDFDTARAVDPVLLFRFSALTFNGHRIHYDRTYAQDVEKYPGLVVHGPLQAILLMEAAVAHVQKLPKSFEFRAVRPLFDFDTLRVCGKSREDGGLDLFTANADGHVSMRGTLQW
jgi:3-methylfumaryl-CoA hydratase